MTKIKKSIVYLLGIVILIMGFSLFAIASENSWSPQFNLDGRIGNEDNNGFIGKGSITYPFRQKENSLFYTDFRGITNGKKVTEYNIGLGYRQLNQNKNYILGGYIFRDWRNEFENNWNQWTLGGELFTELFDLRINGYFPSEERVLLSSVPSDQIIVSGNSVLYEEGDVNSYYKTMNGYDIEIGKRFSKNLPIDLGVYLRTYNFSGEDMDNLTGTGLRVNTNYDISKRTKMSLGIDWQDDNVRGSSVEATIGFSIPLGSNTEGTYNNEEELKGKMISPPERDINVIIGETKPKREIKGKGAALDPDSLEKVNNAWFISAEGNGDGSQENPTNLSELSDNGNNDNIVAKENDLIIALGDDGIINTNDFNEEKNCLVLKQGQKLLSPGGYVILNNERNDRSFIYSPEGIQAKLTNQDINNIVEMADNTTVSGLRFEGGKNAISGLEVSGKLRVTDNVIDNANEAGIFIQSDNVKSLVVNRNIINSAVMGGIAIDVENVPEDIEPQNSIDYIENYDKLNLIVRGNEVKESGMIGLVISLESDESVDLIVDENTVGNAGIGLIVDSRISSKNNEVNNIYITNNKIETANVVGIEVEVDSFEMSSKIQKEALPMVESQNNVEISGNIVNEVNNGEGFEIDTNAYDNLTIIKANKVNYSYYDSFQIDTFGYNNSTVIENNEVNYSYYDGFEIYTEGYNNSLIIKSNTLSYSDDYGFDIYTYGDNENTTLIESNIVDSADDDAFYVYTESNKVNTTKLISNQVHYTYYDGFDINTEGNFNTTVLENNTVNYSDDYAFYIYTYGDAENNTNLLSNIVNSTDDDAFYISTTAENINNTKIKANLVDFAYYDGFDIDTEANYNTTIIEENVVNFADDYGFYIDTYGDYDNILELESNIVNYADDQEFYVETN